MKMNRTADYELNETLLDLVIGCIVCSLFFEVIGLIVVPGKITFSLGLLLGTLVSIGCCVNMRWGIARSVSMDPSSASKSMALYSFVRMLIMFAACGAGLLLPAVSFYGVVTGLAGLKISAYLHVYTNVYITRRLIKKGR